MFTQRNDIKPLIKQIQEGCGNKSCKNSTSCITANPQLYQKLGITDKSDKSQVVMEALRLQIEESYKICDR